MKSYTIDNRGFGWHKKTLRDMEMHGTAKDKSLLGVLKDVIAPAAEQSEESTVTPTDEYDDDDTYFLVREGDDGSLQKMKTNGDGFDKNSEGLKGVDTVEDTPVSCDVNVKSDVNAGNIPHDDAKERDVNLNRDVNVKVQENVIPAEKNRNENSAEDHDINAESNVKVNVQDTPIPFPPEDDESLITSDVNMRVQETPVPFPPDNEEPVSFPPDHDDYDVNIESDVKVEDNSAQKNEQNDGYKVDSMAGVIHINPQEDGTAELRDIVDMSGQYLVDANTNQVYNIDHIDITQFTQIYLIDSIQQNSMQDASTCGNEQDDVSKLDKMVETNYTLKAIVEDVQEVTVKEVKEIDTLDHDVHDVQGDLKEKNPEDTVHNGANDVDKHDVSAADEHGISAADKRDVTLDTVDSGADDVAKHDVTVAVADAPLEGYSNENPVVTVSDLLVDTDADDACASDKRDVHAFEKNDVSDVDGAAKSDGNKSDTSVTTALDDGGSDTTYCTSSDISKDSDIKVLKEVPPSRVIFVSDTTYTAGYTTTASTSGGDEEDSDWSTEKEEEKVRLSPDESRVNILNKQLTLVDKPPRLKLETRGQYMCRLALQFTHNQHKKVTDTSAHSKDSILYVEFTHIFVSEFNYFNYFLVNLVK